LALVELSIVEQRYRAVLDVNAGRSVTEVAAELGVSRQTVHTWLGRYRRDGLGGLVNHPRRPESCPHQASPEVEAAICELRRAHPGWGPRRLVHELARQGITPLPARMTVYRTLVRHGLISPQSRRRQRSDYKRWERETPMALWQLDIVGGLLLADGTECKVVTGVDDHSRFCVIASVVPRATGRAVCLAFAEALRRYGIPDEVLTDNGKQFTARFGRGGEVLFDRICRDNAITHRLTQPASPTTTGKIERFHQTLRRELLADHDPFDDLLAAQATVDTWVREYNSARPHQALGMGYPADRVVAGQQARAEQEQLLPLRLPAALTAAPTPQPSVSSSEAEGVALERAEAQSDTLPDDGAVSSSEAAIVLARIGRAIEFDRVVPASGNLKVAGKQFWLGTARAGVTVTFWADVDVIHLLIAGARVKTLRSHLSTVDLVALAARGGRPAGPPPLPAPEPGEVIEIDRIVNRVGRVCLGGQYLLAAEILAGRRVAIRVDVTTMTFFDPQTRELLRTRPHQLTTGQISRLRGQRAAGPPPRPGEEPVRVQRRAASNGVIHICSQKTTLGRHHAGQIVTAYVSNTTITIDLGDDTRTITRTTTAPVTPTKAFRPRKVTHVS
jgi:transposase InsO family protein